MKVRVVTFPGSNCDKDVGSVLQDSFQADVQYTWYKESFDDIPDLVVLPGGFSFGDYLRCGAMAKFSPSMESVVKYANKGGKVLGVCNGFQILTESGLLPGALLHNRTLKYICKDVDLVPVKENAFANHFSGKLSIPIAHGEGAYFADESTLERLEKNGQIVFRYEENPNGSLHDIAGICNEKGNVLGMMPHPERAMNPYTGKMDGKQILEALLKN
ncbi:phosphoribosylformylglycinamidine synthase subunit PurQ [Leptospira bouyouniensis]|uniref:Phosphoribosylformylglycinamidine synthase subunit PurQ n=1 Tax=Leptospira bouyouniensis TaxID=2484911 RepID=A0A7I0HQK8_9LEPT|nr:phosphoribosylformylglycinamidine synthase subunit PurQ [Leptospira bouyouniensis]TGK48481.1 phosphoribosylformylglycinamidine synthase subunit PurQ [Leptospira bouyouniensis]TGL04453.1 phosphoribosylformylglycinamidine synthase subunit PurQ [Leptospira bouyouniensis]TGM80867.1 phosphoribosylformylglycinamidine synthase subunit PurQ [Leptospira bouyouniensis]